MPKTTSFVDPRSDPSPSNNASGPRLTENQEELKPLHVLCREGRLYEIEQWIRDGRPLQIASGVSLSGRTTSALKIALERGDYALTYLLLCNGYQTRLQRGSPLDMALESRRTDLLDLLLEWGADPHEMDLYYLFATYDSSLFERFRALGVDLSAYHEFVDALAHHTSNKPLFGFARRHRRTDPKIQEELNLALRYHAGEANERGIALCLWAGADPHAPTFDLRYGGPRDDPDDDDPYLGESAIHDACSRGHPEILERLGPDPDRDDFDDLYEWAGSAAVIRVLGQIQLPEDVTIVLRAQIGWPIWHHRDEWRLISKLKALFDIGVRWREAPAKDIGEIRRAILKTSDRTFIEIMTLLGRDDHCSPEIRKELARTSAIQSRMRKVGFLPSKKNPTHYEQPRPTRSREVVKNFGLEPPRPKQLVRSLPHSVRIGRRGRDRQPLHLDREALFELVWSTPIVTLADGWGLSGRGLAKACRRIKIPVPGRGYWAKKQAGKRIGRRPSLPELPAGQAEEIVIWVPESEAD